MKKIAALLTALCLAGCFSCNKPDPDNGNDPEPKPQDEFKLNSYNGEFVIRLSEAYSTWEETNELPGSVNVEGMTYAKGQYVTAGLMILQKIMDDPEHWQDEDVEFPVRCAWGNLTQNNTFEQDTLSLIAFRWAADRIVAYVEKNGITPNYCSFSTRSQAEPVDGVASPVVYTYNYDGDPDGTKYQGNLISRDYGVTICRIFSLYYKNHELPKKVSVWGTDFLHKVTNCETDSPVVIAARDAALSKLGADATPRQKAEALFFYARDEWEWENYSNTSKGSVKTIQAKGGNCCDLTHATLAMCRAAGIPARYLHGQCYFSSGVIGHVIPEIFVDGKWWVCDPSNNSATFGTPVWKGMKTFNGRYDELPF